MRAVNCVRSAPASTAGSCSRSRIRGPHPGVAASAERRHSSGPEPPGLGPSADIVNDGVTRPPCTTTDPVDCRCAAPAASRAGQRLLAGTPVCLPLDGTPGHLGSAPNQAATTGPRFVRRVRTYLTTPTPRWGRLGRCRCSGYGTRVPRWPGAEPHWVLGWIT